MSFPKLSQIGWSSLKAVLICLATASPNVAQVTNDKAEIAREIIKFGEATYSVPVARSVKVFYASDKQADEEIRNANGIKIDIRLALLDGTEHEPPWGTSSVVLSVREALGDRLTYPELIDSDFSGYSVPVQKSWEEYFVPKNLKLFGREFSIRCKLSVNPFAEARNDQSCRVTGVFEKKILILVFFRTGQLQKRPAWPHFPPEDEDEWGARLQVLENMVREIVQEQ